MQIFNWGWDRGVSWPARTYTRSAAIFGGVVLLTRAVACCRCPLTLHEGKVWYGSREGVISGPGWGSSGDISWLAKVLTDLAGGSPRGG